MRLQDLPTLSRDSVRELDRIAIEELGIPGVVLMENAGRGASEAILSIARELPPSSGSATDALILCGPGNNGGDGYVVARHLHDAGLDVTLLETAVPERLSPDAAVFRRVATAMGIRQQFTPDARSLSAALAGREAGGLLVDALLGTGFRGELRTASAELLRVISSWVEDQGAMVIALDAPSGLDVDTGEAAPDSLRATHTLTFAANKPAYTDDSALAWTGEVQLIPIGVPGEAYERLV